MVVVWLCTGDHTVPPWVMDSVLLMDENVHPQKDGWKVMLGECEWQVEDKSEGLLPLLMLGYV